MVTVTAARPMFSTDISVFCGGQSGKHKQRISENAECKILPIICEDKTILKVGKEFKTSLVSLKKSNIVLVSISAFRMCEKTAVNKSSSDHI